MKVPFTFFFLLFLRLLSAKDPSLPPACSVNLGPNVTVCNNAHFTLNPHPDPNGVYTWTGSPGLSCYNCPSPTVSGLTTGVYVYIATVTLPDGCTASDTLFVTVVGGEAPQYEIAPSQNICAGDSIPLGGQNFSGNFYNWFSSPVGFVAATANPKARPLVPTTYYLTVSHGSCIALDSVTITPVSLTLQVTPKDTTVCQGKPVAITATVNPGTQKVDWDPVAGLQIGPNGASAVATPSTSTLYTATASLNGCIRHQQVNVRIDSLPPNLKIDPASDTLCQGETVLLTSPAYDSLAYPNIKFYWIPLTGAVSPDSMLSLTVMPAITTTYRRVTVNGVCRDTALSAIKVIPKPTMAITPDQSDICPGDSVHLMLTYTPGVANINWSPGTGLSCTTCDTPWARPVASQTYTASGTYQGCPVSQMAKINLKPLAPLQFPAKIRLCPGLPVTLNEKSDPAATYVWTSTHPGFGTVTDKMPTYVPMQTATYYVTATAGNGCIRTDSVKITVLPQATLEVEGDTICKNFTATLTATTSIAGLIQWRNDDTGLIIGTGPTIEVSPQQTTNYSVIYTYNGADSCQIVKPILVKVSGEAPVLQFPDPPSICAGDSISLNTGPVLSGSVYDWKASPADPSLAPYAKSANPRVSPGQTTLYTVTASNDNCTVAKQVEIAVVQGSLAVTPTQNSCSGDPVTLVATGTSQSTGTYKWSTGETTASITPKPLVPTTYTVTFTYGNGCTMVKSVQVNVVQGFSLGIQSVPDTSQLNVGTPVTLTAVVTPPQNLSNFTFVWEETTVDTKILPGNGESIDVVPSSNDTNSAEVRYRVTVTSPQGCVKVFEKVFKLIFPLVRFPNAFTPDGDGHNDRFGMVVPQGLAFVDRMEIYNRWGQKIFESTEPNASWDGTVNGQNAPSDVYIYRVWWRRGDGALQMQAKGDITLLR